MYIYNQESNIWETCDLLPEPNYMDTQNLSFITYNVLLDTINGKKSIFPNVLKPKIRYKSILDEIKESQPTFISLNEVSQFMLSMIKNEDWIKENYFLLVDEPIEKHGNVLLSKTKPSTVYLTEVADCPKKIITGIFNFKNGEKQFKLSVSSLHLTSMDYNYPVREKQFRQFDEEIKSINPDGPNVLMGDMNLHSEDENHIFLSRGYRDVWLQINDDKEGYTFDAATNKLIQVMFFGFEKRRMRLDRLLIYDKNNMLIPKAMEIIGTKPIFPDIEYKEFRGRNILYGWYLLLRGLSPNNSEKNYGKYLYNSDHYGLSAQIEISS